MQALPHRSGDGAGPAAEVERRAREATLALAARAQAPEIRAQRAVDADADQARPLQQRAVIALGDRMRRRLVEVIGALPERLRGDADLAARVEAAKTELIASVEVTRLIEDAAEGLRRALVSDLAGERLRRQLAGDEALRRALDRWIKARLVGLIERYHDRIARFIERGVHALGPEGAVRLIEEHAGDDLQYIRVNGTVVGGLAGGALYAIHLLLRLF